MALFSLIQLTSISGGVTVHKEYKNARELRLSIGYKSQIEIKVTRRKLITFSETYTK